jgi:hypothetical protein
MEGTCKAHEEGRHCWHYIAEPDWNSGATVGHYEVCCHCGIKKYIDHLEGHGDYHPDRSQMMFDWETAHPTSRPLE